MRVPKAADMPGVAHGVGATTCRACCGLRPSSIAAEIETPGVGLVLESCVSFSRVLGQILKTC